jgi:hypothetical protein
MTRRADADGRKDDHRQHHDKILDDQKSKRDLPVQRVDLALVGQASLTMMMVEENVSATAV